MMEDLKDKVVAAYSSRFGTKPEVVVRAPGRFNLIGEHTDYNLGFVLPAAIRQSIYLAMGRGSSHFHQWYACDTGEYIEIPQSEGRRSGKGWRDYFTGAWLAMAKENEGLPAISCAFTSDLPPGAGLSSSSALTCGFLLGVNTFSTALRDRRELAWMAHQAERNFTGVQGGIMDQHACLLCISGHFMLLDCRDRSTTQIPTDSQLHYLLINTGVQHDLRDTDYNVRAAECARACELLGVSSLREMNEVQFMNQAHLLDDVLRHRAEFVIRENARVHQAVSALQSGDSTWLGRLLLDSHAGLRDDYEVSCPELDFLVDAACSIPGVPGARMMGGGFGGCTINISERMFSAAYRSVISEQYYQRFNRECTFIDVEPVGGATVEFIE